MTISNSEDREKQTSRLARNGVVMGWRWYHFYFVFALFDLVVIGASLSLYHQTLSSYTVALSEFRRIDEAQNWITNLRIAVVRLNAPGNDVFASRRADEERDRFERTQKRFNALVMRSDEFGIPLDTFRLKMERMFVEEDRIFGIFDRIADENPGDETERTQINTATTFMASMDRYQAEALESLDAVALVLSEKEQRLLTRYGAALARSADFEKYILGIVAFILVGVFWYGRKLQRMHDQMVAQQQRAVEEKQSRLAAVGEVCSAVSHGIRNPLAAITSSAQLALEYGTLDDDTRLRVQDILSEGVRLNQRVSRLLDFSNAKEAIFEPCDIGQIVKEALEEIRPKLESNRVHVETCVGPEPVTVQGDREWLAQSIIEIVSNSMDHLPNGGEVRIECGTTRTSPPAACIDVYDNGPGIPQLARAHVFDLFFTSKADGNGIGLASVRRVVDMHGGRVEVGDMAKSGAHIHIELPLVS